MTPTEILPQRWGAPWLIAAEADTFWSQLAAFQTQFKAARSRDILLAEPDPVRFLAAFFAAVQQPGRVWLANPHWGTQEWSQVTTQCHPDTVIGTVPPHIQDPENIQPSPPTHPLLHPSTPPLLHPTTIHIPTGGSSGDIQFAVHTWDTLAASVQGFCQHFDCATVNAYCVLPLHHVSGLMQALRCLISGGQLIIQPFRELWQTGAIAVPAPPRFLSLVPTQLQRLLAANWDAVPWLQPFTAILLGGGPPWPRLLETARAQRLPLAPTYGMTETAAQVATLLPHEFLSGRPGSGRALPHARLTICDESDRPQPPHQIGRITITADSLALARGTDAIAPPFASGDLGYMDEAGYLHVIGRESTLIMTGGEKVLPAEVEAVLLATAQLQDVAVLGMPDADWGETVVAVIVPKTMASESSETAALVSTLHQHLTANLSPYKIPKRWLVRPDLPRNAQGKLNRSALRRWVTAQRAPIDAATAPGPPSTDAAAE